MSSKSKTILEFGLLRSLSVIEFIEPSIHSQYESATLLFVAISVQRVRIGARVLFMLCHDAEKVTANFW
jgi:hypothetical protein